MFHYHTILNCTVERLKWILLKSEEAIWIHLVEEWVEECLWILATLHDTDRKWVSQVTYLLEPSRQVRVSIHSDRLVSLIEDFQAATEALVGSQVLEVVSVVLILIISLHLDTMIHSFKQNLSFIFGI